MGEALESMINILAGRGDIACAGDVIPLEGQTAVMLTGPIEADFVFGSQGGDEVVCIGARGVANSKIVDDRGFCGAIIQE